MKLLYRSGYLLLILVLFTGCFPQKEVNTRVIKTEYGMPARPGGLLYALPMTSFSVDVEATRITYKKGPYSDWAKQLLDIDKIIDRNMVEWVLDGIVVKQFTEADPGEYYQIISDAALKPAALTLSRQGFLLLLNPPDFNELPAEYRDKALPFEGTVFPVKNLKGKTIEYRDTAYRTVATDTGFIRVPVIVSRRRNMTMDEKARDAANTVIRIRKRKFRLISRNNEDISLPAGPGLAVAVRELDKMEKEYLALFTGKIITSTYHYRFNFTPSDTLDNPFVLFRFLSALGVLPANDLRGDEVTVSWTAQNKTGIRLISPDTVSVQNPAVTYRIPQITNLRITFGSRVLFSKDVLIYQMGFKTGIPANILFQQTESGKGRESGFFR